MHRLNLEEYPFFNPQKGEGEWRWEDGEIEEQEKKARKRISIGFWSSMKGLLFTQSFSSLLFLAAVQGSAVCH